MRIAPLGALLFAACATATGAHDKKASPCGNYPPVSVVVNSNQFADVVIRDAENRRLGIAGGHSITRFHFCAYVDMPDRFILDPIAGDMGYLLEGGGMTITPGSIVVMTLGSEPRIWH